MRWTMAYIDDCSPDPLAVFKGLVSKGMKGKGGRLARKEGRMEGGAHEKCEA